MSVARNRGRPSLDRASETGATEGRSARGGVQSIERAFAILEVLAGQRRGDGPVRAGRRGQSAAADDSPAGPHPGRSRVPAAGAVPAVRARTTDPAARRELVDDVERHRPARTWPGWSTSSARPRIWRRSTAIRSSTSRRCHPGTRCGCSPRSAVGCCRTARPSGKAIMAHMPPGEVRELLQRTGMPRHTEHTITDPEVFAAAARLVGRPRLRHRRRRAGTRRPLCRRRCPRVCGPTWPCRCPARPAG